MVEVLIQVKEIPVSPEQYINTSQIGDIVTYRMDDWQWSAKELKDKRWRILKSAITLTEAEYLSKSEDNEFGNKQYKWKNQRRLDINSDSIDSEIIDWLADDTRIIPIMEVSTDLFRNEALWINKGPAEDYING